VRKLDVAGIVSEGHTTIATEPAPDPQHVEHAGETGPTSVDGVHAPVIDALRFVAVHAPPHHAGNPGNRPRAHKIQANAWPSASWIGPPGKVPMRSFGPCRSSSTPMGLGVPPRE
jgi:hypothetical protein